ncbi:cyclopropane-fatty-acyl-phospholipid synthase (Cyclopropane fatty acid synthase)-like protein [Ramlibacter tataouinensis TTB310]|uniref:Cyclopropane-fatty-acyl-phospholipid synthase (Cyclopropane fatty acid synthase)-like protein n=1 Tax=Ramlibacter tataouinensis (strain ATCC BAA-407 / DSM 14655 / LMG 21543 / TTB310) TaxID=365046 RepID=F5Y067_RAMTT|nr:cyclopropane-fatty-acyl-phospholipid synthase (Cyclopropane fatty acid synthase)-like protein [Ramlibacter tataouinensis TTB310]
MTVALQLPGGRRAGPANAAVILRFSDWPALATLSAGQIGQLAEDYVENRVGIEGSMRDIMLAAAHLLPGSPVASDTGWWTQMMRRAKSLAAHSPQRDARQIQFHYDVSDDFYALWLDPRRVYSCAYYREPGMSLAQAQEAKLDHICRKLMLRAGERFLDIGAGWGGLLLWAAEHYGVQATGITLSKNQHAHVHRLIEEKGLRGRVRIHLMDYRELNESQGFDKIASVGMFEHVGQANMPLYFAKIQRLLKPGGLAMNHGITAASVHPGQLGAGMGDFIGKYIFPGGELLHTSQVLRDLAGAGLEMLDTENLRPHYARTLWAWSDALESHLPDAARVLERTGRAAEAGKVLRAYRLYLAGCAMSFERGWISLHQILAARPDGNMSTGALRGAQSTYPFTREYMYPS